MSLYAVLLALTVTLAASGCAAPGEAQTPPPSEPAPVVPGAEAEGLTGPIWYLVEFGPAAEATPALGQDEVTIQFTEEGVSGSAGCNRFFGGFRAGASEVAVERLGTTRRACRPPQMVVESTYLDALQAARRWSLESGRLHLYDAESGLLLAFRTPQ